MPVNQQDFVSSAGEQHGRGSPGHTRADYNYIERFHVSLPFDFRYCLLLPAKLCTMLRDQFAGLGNSLLYVPEKLKAIFQ